MELGSVIDRHSRDPQPERITDVKLASKIFSRLEKPDDVEGFVNIDIRMPERKPFQMNDNRRDDRRNHRGNDRSHTNKLEEKKRRELRKGNKGRTLKEWK